MTELTLGETNIPTRRTAPRFVNWLRADKRLIVSGGFLALLVLSAIFAPVITDGDPERMVATRQMLPPGEGGLMGTDEAGRDIFTRLLFGTRLTLVVAVTSVAIATILGVAIGITAAFIGGMVDVLLMRLVDALLIFPAFLVAMFFVTFWGVSMVNVILVIGVLYSARFARISYSSTLAVKEFAFIEASRSIGASQLRLMFRGVLPNVMAPVLVQISLSLGTAILLESSLSFLGLGPPEMTSWGRSIQRSARFINVHMWSVFWPALAISLTVLAFNILGDAMRDRLDPRLRS